MKKESYRCFVIMPFDDSFNDTYTKGALPAAKSILESDVIFSRADSSLKDLQLISSVHKHIDSSDFCIADVTSLNPNVLYEVGYAKAIDKEVIIITQDEGPYPLDIAHLIILKYSVGGYDTLAQDLTFAIDRAISSVRQRPKIAKDIYQVECFQNRNFARLDQAFQQAKVGIDILQTNLATVHERYSPYIIKALEENETLKLRVLTLDPDSYFSAKRAEQLGLSVAHYRNELHSHIKSLINGFSRFGGRFAFRIYDDFPTQITFVIDNTVYTCAVSRSIRSRQLCTFKLSTESSGVERSFIFHFESIWASAKGYIAHTLP